MKICYCNIDEVKFLYPQVGDYLIWSNEGGTRFHLVIKITPQFGTETPLDKLTLLSLADMKVWQSNTGYRVIPCMGFILGDTFYLADKYASPGLTELAHKYQG